MTVTRLNKLTVEDDDVSVSSARLLLVPEAPVTTLQTGGVAVEMIVELVAAETGVARLHSGKLEKARGR